MGYVGNQTSNSYTSITKQSITGNGGTSYTLDHAVANANEIEVFVNNVRQEPAVAYTVSGNTLTMTGNVVSTDDFYVIYQGKALQTVVPPDGSVTQAKLASSVTLIPVGMIAPFAMSTAPTGWLECDGSAVSRTTYSDLFAALSTTHGVGDGSTTFNVPDLRGEFIRGWDNGKGTDSGRTFGSSQTDALQNITGTIYGNDVGSHGGQATGAFTSQSASSTYRDSLETSNGSQFLFDASNVARTSTETRPRNIAMMYCVKT